MSVQLADSLEEFEITYLQSCNECSDDHLPRSNPKVTLSSPLLDHSPVFAVPKHKGNIQIFKDTVRDKIQSHRPPLKPSLTVDSISISSNNTHSDSSITAAEAPNMTGSNNLGNPFYQPNKRRKTLSPESRGCKT